MKNITFFILFFFICWHGFSLNTIDANDYKANVEIENSDTAVFSPCDPSEQCTYIFKLTEEYGYSWNGNTMSVIQGGETIATLEIINGQSLDVQVPICDGMDYELYWNPGGTYGSEIGVEIEDPSGNVVYSKPAGTGNSDSSLYTGSGDCPELPENDDLVDAIFLELNANCTGDAYSTVLATAQADEPVGSCFDPVDAVDNSVWFTFEAPENGAVNITTDIEPADFDSQIAVYAAPTDVNDLSSLGEEIACNQDVEGSDNGVSALFLTDLTANETYYIQVDGKQQNQGDFCLEVNSIGCLDPSDLSVSDVMGNSVQVDWTSNGVETEWRVEYGATGFELGDGTVVIDDDGNPGVNLTDLSTDTGYEVYVSAICADDDSSGVVGPLTFTTSPCPEDIEVINNEGLCGAVVNFGAPQTVSGGNTDNLIENPSAFDGLNGWVVDQNGGSGWATNGGFRTSYGVCSMHQEVDLVDAGGFTADQLDDAPNINISEDYIGTGPEFGDTYFLTVELRDADGNVVDDFSTGNINTSSELQTVSHTFSDYGSGVRSVYFSHGGNDSEFWGGNYGALISNAQVKVDLPEINVVQTTGMASGEEFPVGATTNTFEITQGNDEPSTCSFDIIVIDVEAPEAIAKDITVEMNQDFSVNLTPEDIDGGSTDNCGIETMSLNVVSLDCNDLGENEVTLIVTDQSGNSTLATAIVTLTDPNSYCDLGIGTNEKFSLKVYPNPTHDNITIESNDSQKIDKVEFYDLNGRLVKRFSLNTSQVFRADLSQFSNGVYFVKIYSADNSTVKQVIKK